MSEALLFPSKEWSRELAKRLHADAGIQAALRELGPFTAGAIAEKGGALEQDFCVHIEAAPGREAILTFCEDEDELEEMEPDYLVRAPYPLARELLEQTLAGQPPDPLKLLGSRKIAVQGDLGRAIAVGGRHPFAGLETLRAMKTRFI